MMRVILIFCMCVVSMLHAAQITHVKVTDFSDHTTRITFFADAISTAKAFMLEDPSRLVVDFTDSQLAALEQKAPNSTIIRSMRTGSPTEKMRRVVFDLHGPAQIKAHYWVEPGQTVTTARYVVDIAHTQQILAKTVDVSLKDFDAVAASVRGEAPATKERVASANLSADEAMEGDQPTIDPIAALAITVHLKPQSMTHPVPQQFNADGMPLPLLRPKHFAPYLPMIVIDAGHGGKDPGAVSRFRSRVQEKRITLDYARSLATYLRNTGRYRVKLTRDNDHFVALGTRAKIARKAQADLFISLHADASPNRKTRGLSVYTLSAKRAARELSGTTREALKQQKIQGVNVEAHDTTVKHAMVQLAKNGAARRALEFAEILVKHVGGQSQLVRRPHRHASLKVLTSLEVPSVLVELGFLTNPRDEKQLRSRAHRERLVGIIGRTIDAFFGIS